MKAGLQERGAPHAHYRLAFEDHFDGVTLNEQAWSYRIGERLGGLNLRENVELKNADADPEDKLQNIQRYSPDPL